MTNEVNIFVEVISHGITNGKWYDLTDDTDCEALKDFLEASDGIEYIISDYEAPFNIGQNANISYLIDMVSKAQTLSEDYEKAVFYAEAEWIDDLEKLAGDISFGYYNIIFIDGDDYTFSSNSHEALGYREAECLDISEHIERYFDFEAFGRDCAFDYTEIEFEDAYLFYSC